MDIRYILQNQQICMFLIIGKISLRPVEIASRAGWNGFAGRIWPAGRSLETPALDQSVQKLWSFKGLPATLVARAGVKGFVFLTILVNFVFLTILVKIRIFLLIYKRTL